jgi:hypothetical protein
MQCVDGGISKYWISNGGLLVLVGAVDDTVVNNERKMGGIGFCFLHGIVRRVARPPVSEVPGSDNSVNE